MKTLKILKIGLFLVVLTCLMHCGDDDEESPTGAAATTTSCDMSLTMLGQTSHTCMEGAPVTTAVCTQMNDQMAALGGTATFGSGCAAGATLTCEADGVTTHHYDVPATETCATIEAEE
ncbi:MAG: hypothetical protein HQK83_16640 [Fibrobacteria bacterium]|nr:hypothetical protein [Fibrobacteria bacterium]